MSVCPNSWDVPVYANHSDWSRGHEPIISRTVVQVGERPLVLVPTPGHTADSLSILDPSEGLLFTGDTVLGGKLDCD